MKGTHKYTAWISPLSMCVICLTFFGLWCRDLGYHSFTSDESFMVDLCSNPVQQILVRLNSDEPHPPLSHLLLWFWQAVSGSHNEFVIRYLSVAMGIILLCLIFQLGRSLGYSWWAALMCALWIGLNPQISVHFREMRMYSLMLLTAAFAAWVTLNARKLPPWLPPVAWLMALLSHYFNLFFVAAQGVWGLLTVRRERRALRNWVLSQAVTWGIFSLWLPIMGRGFLNPRSLTEAKVWSFALPVWETLGRIVRTGLFGYRDRPHLIWVLVGGTGLAAVWLGGVAYRQAGRFREQRWFLSLSIFFPLLAYAVMCAIKPVFHPKYVLPWLLFVALAVGGLVQRQRWAGVLIAGVLFALAIPFTWRTLQRPYDPGLDVEPGTWIGTDVRDLGHHLVTYAGPTDTFGMNTPDVSHCYYADGYFERRLGCHLLPAYPTQSSEELEQRVSTLLREHTLLWYLGFYDTNWDPQQVGPQVLSRLGFVVAEEVVADKPLLLYTFPERVRNQMYVSGSTLGEVAKLEGVWLAEGRDLYPVLVWRSLIDRPSQTGKVFVHLVDEGGSALSQDDGLPVRWLRPLQTWELDELLFDAHTLLRPSGVDLGRCTLRIGIYDPDTMQRFPAHDADGDRLPDDYVAVPLERLLNQR